MSCGHDYRVPKILTTVRCRPSHKYISTVDYAATCTTVCLAYQQSSVHGVAGHRTNGAKVGAQEYVISLTCTACKACYVMDGICDVAQCQCFVGTRTSRGLHDMTLTCCLYVHVIRIMNSGSSSRRGPNRAWYESSCWSPNSNFPRSAPWRSRPLTCPPQRLWMLTRCPCRSGN